MPTSPASLSTKDRWIIVGLVFFCLFNLPMDLYLVLHSKDLAERASANWFAYFWAIYADVDLAQEALNVFVATPVNVWLIWAIVTRAPRRHPLQLALGRLPRGNPPRSLRQAAALVAHPCVSGRGPLRADLAVPG